jgi:DNA modification methylase
MNLPPLQVQSWPVSRLLPYARSARTHSDSQVNQIAASIAEFGFNNPVLADPSGSIIAGHARVLAARKLGYTEVPVIALAHLSEAQKRAFRLADNKLALNAGWNLDLLRQELEELAAQDFSLPLTGFLEEELQELLAQDKQQWNDPDEAPEVGSQAISSTGDLWLLGNHRLLCADATQPESLVRVLAGQHCQMVFTDLPYNVNYEGKTPRKLKLVNDNLGSRFGTFLTQACQAMLPVSDGPLYLCMSSSELHRLYAAFTEAGGHWSTYVIWAKNTFTLGRSDYQRQYEPILYGWPEGKQHFWCGARNQSDVWFIDKPHRNDLHPTMKPVALIEQALANSSRAGDLILDPYAGSGSTLIACEQQGRCACLVELDPCYVDVIVRRWQDHTGKRALLEHTRCTFEEVTAERLAEPRREAA